MNSIYDWLIKFYGFCMIAVVIISSGHGLKIKVCHRNQPFKTISYHLQGVNCFYFYSCLKQLYVSKKTECFSYRGGCFLSSNFFASYAQYFAHHQIICSKV